METIDKRIKIEELIDYAYDKTIERINAIETAPKNLVYRSMITKPDHTSFLLTFSNYYVGCFEGILFTRFLEEFNRMPTPSENSFIKDESFIIFEDLKNTIFSMAELKYAEYKKQNI